ncbi:MAG: hypothetical protein COT43_09955 [Candidatus Marinimicrobia bacterium CG08_land_8_20_14_0_20_45_22]|nr:MAG: hypothetical protein COT43_09955 [Candidatus Marinimicrobia bacterium CG08_land_8_20_14_0_20_45_22]
MTFRKVSFIWVRTGSPRIWREFWSLVEIPTLFGHFGLVSGNENETIKKCLNTPGIDVRFDRNIHRQATRKSQSH